MIDNKKKTIAIVLTVFAVTLVIGTTYAFITQTLTGTKEVVVSAGVLDLVLDEKNEITISDALPMYDQVGMIQEDVFNFDLINTTSNETRYKIKLQKISTDNELQTSDVKYYLTKDGVGEPAFLSTLTDGIIDAGIIEGNDTINYTLRLWISDAVTDKTTITGKSLSYKLVVEAGMVVTLDDVVIDYAKPVVVEHSQIGGSVFLEEKSWAKYGNVEINGDNSVGDWSVTYTPNKILQDIDTVHLVAEDGQEVTFDVIPANSVFYEDDFAGIEYSGNWVIDGVEDNTITADSVSLEGNNSVHGWEDVLADDTGYSGGSAHVGEFEHPNMATAIFRFKGTGVDIYARVNGETGRAVARLYKAGEQKAIKVLSVDQLSKYGDYYQIPTLFFENLEYGEYEVDIRVGRGIDKDENGNYTYRTTYYLDGIRVYNPLGENDGKYAEKEQDFIFTNVREILLDSGSFGADNSSQTGAVFIEQLNQSGAALGTYGEEYGVKNEVYLESNQSIVFKVNKENLNAHYYIGLKSLTGEDLKVNVTSGEANNMKEILISSTSDMYYEIAPNSEGYIVIKNATEDDGKTYNKALLSITKLRTTNCNGENNIIDINPEEALNQAE